MKATQKLIKKANLITAKYSKWLNGSELQEMYSELEAIGVTTGLITNRKDNQSGSWTGSCEWYFEGVEVENSYYIYQVYEGGNTEKKEYNIYFS